jgi:hypothetical protein
MTEWQTDPRNIKTDQVQYCTFVNVRREGFSGVGNWNRAWKMSWTARWCSSLRVSTLLGRGIPSTSSHRVSAVTRCVDTQALPAELMSWLSMGS